MYELKLENFSGPLEKLLELIEEKKLDVKEVSLAQVTDDFLRYLRTLTARTKTDISDRLRSPLSSDRSADHLRLVADFIAIASRLILIKSKFLLPDLTLTGEEEASIKDLERRLQLYAEIRPIMKNVQKLWSGKKTSFGRPYFLELGSSTLLTTGGQRIFYPGENLELEALVRELGEIFENIQNYVLETGTIKEKIITIEEKISEIMERLKVERETKFDDLASMKTGQRFDEAHRREIIAIFLAILHLAREQLIFLEQAERFSDILIWKR
ncbi:MAG: segregation/condensation protein A [Patescibacteria group bacterium]